MDATPQEWKRLVDGALRVKQLAPWTWMDEDEVFGIRHPQTGELGFISVMGALGQHTAVALYLGTGSLSRFLGLQAAQDGVLEEYPEFLLEIPQLQAAFENREELDDWDRQLLRNLNLKFRGRKAWPRFQSFRPGFMPWRLEPAEVRFLTLALEQLAVTAPRVAENPRLLTGKTAGTFLIRSCPPGAEGPAAWEDRFERLQPPEFPAVPLSWDPADVAKLQSAAAGGEILEMDVFMVPAAIGGRNERPRPGYLLLVLHAPSNMVLAAEVLEPAESFEEMWGRVPGLALSRLAATGLRPSEVRVQSPRLADVLAPAFKEIGARIVLKPALKKLRTAKRELMAFLEKGPPPETPGLR